MSDSIAGAVPNQTIEKKRIAKWDNLKFLMILCVVTGHFLGEMVSGDPFGQTVYLFIYTFHMPVFIFLAGMFSKNAVNGKRYEVIIEYAVIYLVMKVLEQISACLKSSAAGLTDTGFSLHGFLAAFAAELTGGNAHFHIFWAEGPEWFAFAMAAFFAITMLIKDYPKKYMLPLAVFAGCIAGLDTHLGPVSGLGNHFCAMRIAVFYPVFLSGYYMDSGLFLPDQKTDRPLTTTEIIIVHCSRKRIFTVLSVMVLITVFLLCFLLNRQFTFGGQTFKSGFLYAMRDFFKGKCSYYNIGKIAAPAGAGQSLTVAAGLFGVPLRLGLYILWSILIFAILRICPKREWPGTVLGQRTMSVFIWHKLLLILVLYVCQGKTFLLNHMPHTYLPAAICLAVSVTVIAAYLPEFRIAGKIRQGNF